MSGFCEWYGKNIKDVSEHEQQQCEEMGLECFECQDLVVREQDRKERED